MEATTVATPTTSMMSVLRKISPPGEGWLQGRPDYVFASHVVHGCAELLVTSCQTFAISCRISKQVIGPLRTFDAVEARGRRHWRERKPLGRCLRLCPASDPRYP